MRGRSAAYILSRMLYSKVNASLVEAALSLPSVGLISLWGFRVAKFLQRIGYPGPVSGR